MRALLPALAVALLLVGSLQYAPLPSQMKIDIDAVEVSFGALWPGSSAGLEGTNATATVDAGVILQNFNVLRLNNTNATGAWYVRFVATSATNVANLLVTRIGIDNGTASSDQVVALASSLTQTEGAYVRLEPGSVNTIYAATLLSIPTETSGITFDVYVSDDGSDASRIVMKGALTLT